MPDDTRCAASEITVSPRKRPHGHDARDRLQDLRRRHAVRRSGARPDRSRGRRGRRHDVHGRRHPDGNDLRRWLAAEQRPHGRAARRRQTPAHRRIAVHDGVPEPRRRARRSVAFGAPYPGKIIPVHLDGPRRRAARAEGFVPVRGQGRERRHRVHQAARRRASSAAKASSCSGCRAMGFAFIHAGGTILRARSRSPAKCCAWTRAASWRSSRAWITTFSSSATSRARCSAAKACSSPRCAGPGQSGCSRCRSAASPDASSAPCRIGRGGREEGSVLGGLGRLLDGDNS